MKSFEIRIFSNPYPINFLHFYLIYFYIHRITFPKNTPYFSILAHFKSKAFEICKPVSLLEVLWYLIVVVMWIYKQSLVFWNLHIKSWNLMQICSWISSKHFLDNHILLGNITYKLSYFEKQPLTKKVFLKILQSSQENASIRVSFLIRLQGLQLYHCNFIKK